MALLGIYVGVIPVASGWSGCRSCAASALVIRALIAFTVGLLASSGSTRCSRASRSRAGAAGIRRRRPRPARRGAAYLALIGVDALMRARERAEGAGASAQLAMMIAIGIGLHNLGEGLAIGSAYAAGALALGAFLVVGFAIHNTTEGLAIVAPLADSGRLGRLVMLGLIAGAPAILGAWSAPPATTELVSFLIGGGSGRSPR